MEAHLGLRTPLRAAESTPMFRATVAQNSVVRYPGLGVVPELGNVGEEVEGDEDGSAVEDFSVTFNGTPFGFICFEIGNSL